MRFHQPFDEVQLNAAAKTHAQMRANLRELRRSFPPVSLEEHAILTRYRDMIQDSGRELLKPYDRIDSAKVESRQRQGGSGICGVFVGPRPG
jgi:hypothetical protein